VGVVNEEEKVVKGGNNKENKGSFIHPINLPLRMMSHLKTTNKQWKRIVRKAKIKNFDFDYSSVS
jgi:hypothetical protein